MGSGEVPWDSMSGEAMGPVVTSEVRVRYAETDAMGIVYHANYLVYFEVGRTDFCEAAGYPYPKMEADGVRFAVVEAHAKFRRPARYGDLLTVRTRFGGFRSRGSAFIYEILLPDGSLSVEGRTDHLFLDENFRPRSVPPLVRESFEGFMARI